MKVPRNSYKKGQSNYYNERLAVLFEKVTFESDIGGRFIIQQQQRLV